MASIDSRRLFTGDLASQTSSGEPALPRDPAPWPPPEAPPVAAPAQPSPAAPDIGPAASADPAVDRQAALRALRNLEATEARLERNARREADETRARLVQELLPVLDNLDRTIRAAQAGRGDPAILEGVRMVRQQLEGVLRGYGVERIDALGQRFDPAVHEAIGMVAVDDPQRHGAVVQQAEPGYRLAGRLLRPARVSVGKLASPYGVRPAVAWR
ncbi:MAG TPA: nucleotide exchange factor GrpE [Kofleriaceae bacterium]|nr:nucleotide exchange factor GrpE [Kofleriaceae bacterium]